MQTFTVSFFGHKILQNDLKIEKVLEVQVKRFLTHHEYVEFLVGRDGEFDLLAASVIRRCKRELRSDNSSLTWILSYPKTDLLDKEAQYKSYYDEIEICEASQICHYKKAYQVRNQVMVDRSDIIIFCVQHEGGGAWKTMKYAQKQGKPIVNLNDLMEAQE